MREQFEEELIEVKDQVNRLARRAQEQLKKSVDSLVQQDPNLAEDTIQKDQELDQLDMSINEHVVLLIAKQQPVATDLRHLISAIRISTDLERMADNAKNIARVTIQLKDESSLVVHPNIEKMQEIANDMLDQVIKAYHEENIILARDLAEQDDQIDHLYANVMEDLVNQSSYLAEDREITMQNALCARYLERFGDHLTNISESITYMVKGEIIDLNK